jgi:hypothetical protein
MGGELFLLRFVPRGLSTPRFTAASSGLERSSQQPRLLIVSAVCFSFDLPLGVRPDLHTRKPA